MSITKCPYCDNEYDQDFEVEHEEICKQEKEAEQYEADASDRQYELAREKGEI